MPAPIPATGLVSPRLPRSPRVLLLVDFMNPLDFPGGDQLAAPAAQAAHAAAALKRQLGQNGVTTIYANDNYGVWHSDFHSLVSACLGMDGPPGEIAPAFYASPLELLLAEMQARELVICGLATDMCVQLTAGDAFLREYKVCVPADCTAAESKEAKAASLAYMADVLKCDTHPCAPAATRRKSGKKTHA